MKVKIINRSAYPSPAYATGMSAGMDLKANIQEPVTLNPLCRDMIPTGLFIALPEGYEAQVRPLSGLAAKHGITVLNTPGTIDADYRGEIKNASDRYKISIELYTQLNENKQANGKYKELLNKANGLLYLLKAE